MSEIMKYTCPKCGNKQYETGEIWTVGSIWTRMFEVHNRRFTFLTCQKCKFTELYKVPLRNFGELYNNIGR
jgi:predicted nucleic-acid-binding Zn-ribbon protein